MEVVFAEATGSAFPWQRSMSRTRTVVAARLHVYCPIGLSRPAEIRAAELRAAEICPGEVRLAEIRRSVLSRSFVLALTPMHRMASRRSRDSCHDQTYTGKQTMNFRAHHAWVGCERCLTTLHWI
jgi:hypothetical protein